jgi:hypothetical protein
VARHWPVAHGEDDRAIAAFDRLAPHRELLHEDLKAARGL